MTDTFEYRPKFVDIRVKKPNAATMEREPSDRPCDQIGCRRAGAHRAPKARDNAGEFWHFCSEHAAAYNQRWNYFSGMSEGEFAAYLAREEVGHRPTWSFKGGRGDRLSAHGFQAGRRRDPFGLFGAGEAQAQAASPKRRLTRLQTLALDALLLDETATAAQIRTRYAELVKRWHPDSNGGDRSAEDHLQRVVQAYQTLKAGGLV